MFKKSFAAIALAVLAVIAVPAAANAAGYVPQDRIIIAGNPEQGATVIITFQESFTPGERVSVSVSGTGSAVIGVVKAATVTSEVTASATGTVVVPVTLPTDASGSYTVTATGLTSGTVGVATLTVPAADSATGVSSNGGLASTGYDAPMLAIWAAAGALLLGVALMVALTVVRRQRANA